MPDTNDENERTPSTTWEWRRVRMSPAPHGQSHRERSEASKGSLLPWPRRKPITVTLKWRGGPECWWEIRARGRTWRRPGVVAIQDLMTEIMAWQSHPSGYNPDKSE